VKAPARPRRHGTRSKDASTQRRAWWGALALPAALTCTAIVHWSALGTFFAADDITFLSRARGLEPTPWSFARPLSEGLAWQALHAGFGLDPFPYHLFILALHLGSTAMVFGIGRRLLAHGPLPGAPMGGRGVSAAAATLFGTSAVAFTPLHWTSSLVEVVVTFFALAGLLAYLVARERGSGPGLWLSAILGFAAMLSKENAILFPLAVLVVDRRSGLFPPQARTLVPAMAASAA
jgi:hypothetical protein